MPTGINTLALQDAVTLAVDNCYLQTIGVAVPPPNLIGAPGAGKTASIHNLASKYDFGVLSTHFALKAFEETGGIPQIEEIKVERKVVKGTIWTFPDIMKPLYELSEATNDKNQKDGGKRIVIWLLDDSHLMGPVHLMQMYELLTERALRGYKIPTNVGIILAGNDGSSMAGAKTKFSAIINRIQLMPVHADFENWKTQYALKNHIHPAIMSFLSQDHYKGFFHGAEQVDKAWPSPRSWTYFSNILTFHETKTKKIVDEAILLYIGNGVIGSDATAQFAAYYKIYVKFDMKEILKNYKTFNVPTVAMDQYALAYALINFYVGNKDRTRYINECIHILSVYMKQLPDIAIVMCKELIAIEKAIGARNIADPILKKLQQDHSDLLSVLQEALTL